MYFVYILKSKIDNNYYIGFTENLQKRLERHNSCLVRSTKHRIPFQLIYFEEYQTKREALRREKQIKSYKGGEAFKNLLNS